MKYESVEYISFSEDQEGIRKVFPACMIERATQEGLEVNILLRKTLSFVVLFRLGEDLKAYWMPFFSTYEEFSQFARLIDFRHETSLFSKIMAEAYKWQIRKNHPDFPCELEPNAWELYDLTYQLL